MTIKDRIKQLDIFGKPINLTYEGLNTYKTAHGALFTIIMVIGMLTYALSTLINVVDGNIK